MIYFYNETYQALDFQRLLLLFLDLKVWDMVCVIVDHQLVYYYF
jgi:hypothetical protein